MDILRVKKTAWENNMQHQQIINKLGLNLKAVYNMFIYALKDS